MRSALLLAAVLLVLGPIGCQRARPAGELVIAEESAPVDFDPRFALDAYSSRINNLLYAGLLARDENARLVPDLAESYAVPDARTIVVRLREGLRFHDGRPLTAADVAFTFDSIRDPALRSPRADAFAELVTAAVVDPRTVRFTLRRPFAPFLDSLTQGIVPRASGRELSRRPVGAGPFALVDFEPGARTVLRRFETYHRGLPGLRRVVVKAVPNDITRVLELRKGSVQLLINSVPPDALAQFAAQPRFRVYRQPGLNVSYLGFRLADPVLSLPQVRRAIAHAVDRRAIIASLLAGHAAPVESVLSPLLPDHAGTLEPIPYDPELALRLLDEAGLRDPDGDGPLPRFSLIYKTSTNPLRRRIAEAIAEQLRAVGIGVEVRSLEFGTFFDDIRSGNFQLFSLTWVGIVEPDALYNMFHSASRPPSGANRGGYAVPEVDAWIEAARAETDSEARRALYVGVQERLAADLPYVTLWVQDDIAVASERLENFRLFPGGDYGGIVTATMR